MGADALRAEEAHTPGLEAVVEASEDLRAHFSAHIREEAALTRRLVSYQAGKTQRRHRWFKFKEAFSTDLVRYLFERNGVRGGELLDPFAGSGTSLFAAAEAGMDAVGIEVMPLGCLIIRARDILRRDDGKITRRLERWAARRPWERAKEGDLSVLRITDKAYPEETERQLRRCLSAIRRESGEFREVLLFALMCVLEEVSYTRKDGQFLRWDNRSGRDLRQVFHKGDVPDFPTALTRKIGEIVHDERDEDAGRRTLLDDGGPPAASVTCHNGSCLEALSGLEDGRFGAVMTSPPYCNRYDYTRTYALELAALGLDEAALSGLRQRMLSCTVENRAKELLALNPGWDRVVRLVDAHELLMLITGHLDRLRELRILNNSGIARMVKGYFAEMACVIHECGRTMASGGHLFMVNDNVRFAGCEVPVDLILSHFAEQLGFEVVNILVLPQGKGNSSQQMGKFGRVKLRKCVYHWRKP